MKAYKLPGGNLLVPVRLEGPGGALGDGMAEVSPDTEEYERWRPFIVDEPLPADYRGEASGGGSAAEEGASRSS